MVRGVCCGPQVVPPLDEGCQIKRFPVAYHDVHKRTLCRTVVIDTPGSFSPSFHYNCPDNQVKSLIGRVAKVVPHPTKSGLRALYAARDLMIRHIPKTSANSLADMPERYSGAKRQRYRDALRDYLYYGLNRSHASIKFFVKLERFNPYAKVNPDPRAIQFRGPRFAVALASYLHPIEDHIYHFSHASNGVPPTRNVAKGLNSVDRARVLHVKLSAFERPVVVSMDASRFDMHVSESLLRIEHSIYLASNGDPFFAQLLSWQLKNKGFSNLGLKYVLKGRRMSGDMNTAAGNCLLMLCMLISFGLHLKLSKWDCFDDGDDCLLIIEDSSLPLVLESIHPVFLSYGMEMKIEHVAWTFAEILFCRSSPVEFSPDKWKFVRDYRGVMSTALSGTRSWDSNKYRLRVLRAIGLCELIINLGVPVLQSYAVAILRSLHVTEYDISLAPTGLTARASRDLKHLGLSVTDVRPQEIQLCARESFATAFGLPMADQLRIERALDSVVFTFTGQTSPFDELGPEWSWIQTTNEVYSV